MKPFSTFLDLLGKIEDPRRAEGKLYRLPHVILFAILASIAGANSYRSVHTFIRVHLPRLRKLFRLKWRRAPAYTTIRGILLQLDPAGVERVFREHARALCAHENIPRAGHRHVARSEEHTSELQSRPHLVCRLLLEKKKKKQKRNHIVKKKKKTKIK